MRPWGSTRRSLPEKQLIRDRADILALRDIKGFALIGSSIYQAIDTCHNKPVNEINSETEVSRLYMVKVLFLPAEKSIIHCPAPQIES